MYVVEKQIANDGMWQPVGTWSDPCEMAKTMWELGLSRPDYIDIRVRKEVTKVQFHGDERIIQYLMEQCNVTYEVALIALNHNGGSVLHAHAALQNGTCKYQYIREAREYELGE